MRKLVCGLLMASSMLAAAPVSARIVDGWDLGPLCWPSKKFGDTKVEFRSDTPTYMTWTVTYGNAKLNGPGKAVVLNDASILYHGFNGRDGVLISMVAVRYSPGFVEVFNHAHNQREMLQLISQSRSVTLNPGSGLPPVEITSSDFRPLVAAVRLCKQMQVGKRM